MKPVRRFISTVITKNKQQQQQQQQEKIHHSTRFQQQQHKNLSPNRVEILSKHSLASPTTSLLKRIAYCPINSLTRLALRALFQLGEQSANNALLATTSINRALKYSVGVTTSPSSRVHTAVRMEPAPNQAAPTNADIDTNTAQVTNTAAGEIKRVDDTTPVPTAESRLEENDPMVALEDHRSGTTLACLREAYANSRKKGTNVWLDFADKSCYIYLYRGGGEPNRSLAAFDLDGTLIKPKSNKRIPRSATDWDLFSVWTKIKLQQCLRENHARFVIFTNQNGVGLEIVPLEEVQHRIELVTKRLDIPCTVFVAIEKDIFRKPQTGMFQLFNKSFNDLLPVDFASSFYCGDAIGYPSHSDADIKFAKQLGFPFLTPEKFLRGVKPKLVS